MGRRPGVVAVFLCAAATVLIAFTEATCSITWSPEVIVVGEAVKFAGGACTCSKPVPGAELTLSQFSYGVYNATGWGPLGPADADLTSYEYVLIGSTFPDRTSTIRFNHAGTYRVCLRNYCRWLILSSWKSTFCYDCVTVTVHPKEPVAATSGVGTPPPPLSPTTSPTPPPSSAPTGPASFAPLPSSPPVPSLPSLPTGTVKCGGYTLRIVETIKCASVEERPYTSMLIGAIGGGELIHLPKVLVDSGADVSMFPAWVASVLGIDLSKAQEIELGGIGGGKAVGHVAQVRIGITHLGGIETDVDGYILGSGSNPYLPTITVAFVEDDEEFILGRLGAFDLFDLDFTSDTVIIRVPQ